MDRRIDRDKIEGYLLHPVKGRGKSVFLQAYGFDAEGVRLITAYPAWPTQEM